MAKRSLFAILTDQPWWVSVLVAGLVFAMGSIVSPLIGAAAALPFVGVSIWVGWLRLRRGPSLDVPLLLKALRAASPDEMRAMLAEVYQPQKYALSDAPEGDLKLERNGYTTLVRFRRWRAQSTGPAALKEFKTTLQAEEADHGIYITAGVAADGTREQAGASDIMLIDGPALAALVGRTGTARKVVRRVDAEAAQS